MNWSYSGKVWQGDRVEQGVEGMFQAEGIACAKHRDWAHLRNYLECGWHTANGESYGIGTWEGGA